MRIGVDLDETSYPFVDTLARWIHAKTGRPLDEMPPAREWAFYESWGYPVDEFLKHYREGVDAAFILSVGVPIAGARDAILALQSSGHTIHFVTDRFVGECAQANTEEWLTTWEIPYDSITYTKDKTVVQTDAFIDDKVTNVDELRAVGCLAYVFDRGRSEQQGHPHLISDWPAFVAEIERLSVE